MPEAVTMGRGFVYTVDGVFALGFALAAVAASAEFWQDAGRAGFDGLEQVRAAYDIGFALDEAGLPAGENTARIGEWLARLRADNRAISLEVGKYCQSPEGLRLAGYKVYGDTMSDDYASVAVLSDAAGGCWYMTTVRAGPR
jgi:hypothetical protein